MPEFAPPRKIRGGVQMSLSFSRHRAAQDIVNAQVSVGRAVHELNRRGMSSGYASDGYLQICIAEAISDLSQAMKRLISTPTRSQTARSGRQRKTKNDAR